MDEGAILQVRDLARHYRVDGTWLKPGRNIRAVDGVSFDLMRGETFGLVGESGCGKSTVGRTILRLNEATAGEVIFNGVRLAGLSRLQLRRQRKAMQMIFQDPYASLNPKRTVRKILGEPLEVHEHLSRAETERRLVETMERVGLASHHLDRYPHEFSGGQRQRIGIARAVISQPMLIVADEPVSALDVSVQSQVLNLLMLLQRQLQLTYLFISHDLGVVRHIADRVAVMYLGVIVEIGATETLFANPRHPYTRALLSAIPPAHPRLRRSNADTPGEMPDPANPPSGCRFHPRCPARLARCSVDVPGQTVLADGVEVACHLYTE